MRSSNVQWILLAACLLLSPLGSWAQTPEADRVWTTVGSAGTLDEESEGKVFFDRAVVQKGQTLVIAPASRRPRAEGGADVTDSAVIRYNVTAVDGLFGSDMLTMAVRYLDDGQGARVVVQLIEVNLATGAEGTRLTFDSDAAGVQVVDGYQVENAFECDAKPLDFVQNAYFIEATLTTSSIAETSAAGIEIIQLSWTPCTRN